MKEKHLRAIRQAFSDMASLSFQWHPVWKELVQTLRSLHRIYEGQPYAAVQQLFIE